MTNVFKPLGLLFALCLTAGSIFAQDDLSELTKHFAEPGNHYGSAPLWVWNTKVTKTDIDSMLYGFRKNAFGGVFVHPRPGLITEYLSKEWLDDYAYTVKKARELGLDVWIYDENSYPSGFAGGHVPDEMPESYNQGQMLHLTKAGRLPEDVGGTGADGKEKYVYVLKEENGQYVDITSRAKEYAGKDGNYYLFSKEYYYRSPWFGGFSYVDLMAKGVTEKFIDVTMKGYEQTIGSEFGKTVRGIFSDEANIESQGSGNVRWTPDLFTTFRQKWGYDLVPNLPSLYEETGDWKKVRHNYFQTLLDLFVDRWSKPFAAYAAGKNLEWTGHYWEHDWPNPNNGPDNMAMYVYPQRPGIDMLFNQFNETSPGAQFGNIRSVKELASVSNQMGKKRNLSETYGGGGWDLTFRDMKRLGDWEFVLGVNTLNQHLAHMTINGARKYDYPQSFSYHTPWWPYYGSLNVHFTRLTYALTRGEELNDVLVLEPTTTAWMYYSTAGADKRFGEIGQNFQSFVTRLQKAQVEYDLGSEYVIRGFGSVAGGKFVVGKRSYRVVVIPPGMENADKRTMELLKEFAGQGGKIVQFGKIQYVDGADGAGDLTGTNVVKGGENPEEQLRTGGTYFEVKGGDLYHMRRQLKDGQLLFLANSDMKTAADVRVTISTSDFPLAAYALNTFTGEIKRTVIERDGFHAGYRCSLPPAGSMLIFIKEGPLRWKQNKEDTVMAIKRSEPVHTGEATVISNVTARVVRPKVNTLMIDFCDVHIGDAVLKDRHVYYAADTVYKHFGFGDGNPWNTSVQFKRNIVDRDTFSRGQGFSVTYKFTVDGAMRGLEAVVERAGNYTIAINGKVVKPEPGKWWLDKSFGVLKIGAYVRSGENSLTLSTDKMSIYDEVEPVYILGDFNLVSAAKGWTLAASTPLGLGSWKEQGMPMYGQGVHYVKEFNAEVKTGHVRVKLGKWNGTMAAVTVNGKAAGVIAYDPYELDITKYLVAGKNKVDVEVIGSLKNLLGPHHGKHEPGLASPWHWRYINTYPAGKDYETIDYGLMEDFQVVAEVR